MRPVQTFTQRLHWNGLVVLLACPFVFGCGPTVEVEQRPAGPPPILPNDAAPALQGCATPALVPKGDVWLGPMNVTPTGETSLVECAGSGNDIGTTRFVVNHVFLDKDEVTNECYQHCVDTGACKPPLDEAEMPAWTDAVRSKVPAVLDQERAEAFCAFRGGRLPSVAELARASQGDSIVVGSGALLRAWGKCFNEEIESPECLELASHIRLGGFAPYRPDRAIRSEIRDVGPFGHYDLFGAQIELTITQFPEWYPDNWCTTGQSAPGSFTNDPQANRAYYAPGLIAGANYVYVVDGFPPDLFGAFSWDPYSNQNLSGARCAYDVAP